MSSVLQELFLWDQSANSSCSGRMDCDSFYELGPPPDMILTIPPPPVPPFMEEFVSRLASEGINIASDNEQDKLFQYGRSCSSLCQWANGDGVGFVELAQKGPLIDDTWFLVIISSCVGATLIGIILAIAFLKYREGKLKPLSDVALAKKEKALGLERCEAVLYPAPPMPPPDTRTSRALWAGLKPLEGNHYTVDHCQPMDQKPTRLDFVSNPDSTYDYADYASLNFTSLANSYGLTTQVAPPNPCPATVLSRPVPAASFENVGFVSSDDTAVAERVGNGGSVLTQAAFLLGTKPPSYQHKTVTHVYEMVSPRLTPSRRHKSLERGARPPPIISAPTSVPAVILPALNSRYSGKYTLTALANGSHTLTPKLDSCKRIDRRQAHVSLDRSGNANTCLARTSPDHIYASPITSPVI